MSEASEALEASYSLFPYQRQVFHDILDVLLPSNTRAGRGRVVAHLPTGAGKTRIACYVACALLNHRFGEDRTVIWLASTEELCEQAAESLSTAWNHVGNREISIQKFWGSDNEGLAEIKEGFLVAGLPKLWALASKQTGFLSPSANAAAGVIFDEAHQAVAPTYSFIAEQLTAYGAPLLGLTATPGRGYRMSEEDYDLAEMFDNHKVSICPRGHPSPVTYLIKNQFLADPDFVTVPTVSGVELREPSSGAGDYRESELRSLGRDDAWRRLVADTTATALESHKRVIAFCPSVACAAAAAQSLQDAGYRAETIFAETPVEQRRKTISRFRDGSKEPMALLNFGVLTAGFDAPSTSCVVIARPTRSLVLYSQMVGRALRGPRSGGNRWATIYTIVDGQQTGFASVVDAFHHWEDLWRTPAVN